MCVVARLGCSLDAFSNVLHKCCSERELLATPDVAHLLSMSVVMLNTRCAQRYESPNMGATRVHSSFWITVAEWAPWWCLEHSTRLSWTQNSHAHMLPKRLSLSVG